MSDFEATALAGRGQFIQTPAEQISSTIQRIGKNSLTVPTTWLAELLEPVVVQTDHAYLVDAKIDSVFISLSDDTRGRLIGGDLRGFGSGPALTPPICLTSGLPLSPPPANWDGEASLAPAPGSPSAGEPSSMLSTEPESSSEHAHVPSTKR